MTRSSVIRSLALLALIVYAHAGQLTTTTVIYTGDELAIQGSTRIFGSVRGNADLTVDTGSSLYDATVAGNVIVDRGSNVNNIIASGSVALIRGSTAASVAQNQQVAATSLHGISTLQQGAASVTSGVISPGCYDSLSVNHGQTVTLTAGTYSFTDVYVGNGANINVQATSSLAVVVTVDGNFVAGHGFRLNGDAARTAFLINGSVNVGNGALLNGNFFVPNGDFYVGYGSNVNGGIYAKNVELTNGDSVVSNTYNGYTSAAPAYTSASLRRNMTHLNTVVPVSYYYPSNGAQNQKFPLIVFLQGGNTAGTLYSSYAALVASYGYVVAVPDYFRSVGGPANYFTSIALVNSAEDDIRSVGGVPADPDTVIVSGHSLGGALAIAALGTTCDPASVVCEGYVRRANLKGAVVFATNNRNMSNPVFDQFLTTNANGGFITYLQGTIDGRAFPSRAQGTFDNTANTDKRSLIFYSGMNHYGITNTATPVGSTPDPNVETGDHAEGLALLARDTHLSIDGFLNGNKAAIQFHLVGYRDSTRYSRNIQIEHPCN
jgi:pimeloyl-ACP methyl ester carboxylesterase